MKFYDSITLKTTEEAIKCNSPELAVIRKEQGDMPTMAAIVKILGALAKFFTVGKGMDSLQLAETAKLLLQEYYFLKIEDLKLCFDRMKLGHYGQTYDRVDGNVILLAVKAYCDERMNVAESLSIEAHKEAKEAEVQDMYLIKIDANYLQENEEKWEEVTKKELATQFNFKDAIRHKNGFQKVYQDATFKIVHAAQIDILRAKEIRSRYPSLVTNEDKYIEVARKYSEAKKAIMADEKLSDFEKVNAVRALTGISSLTPAEYAERGKWEG